MLVYFTDGSLWLASFESGYNVKWCYLLPVRKLNSALPALLGVRYMVKKAQHERIVVMMNLCEGVVSGCLCSLSVFVAATFLSMCFFCRVDQTAF